MQCRTKTMCLLSQTKVKPSRICHTEYSPSLALSSRTAGTYNYTDNHAHVIRVLPSLQQSMFDKHQKGSNQKIIFSKIVEISNIVCFIVLFSFRHNFRDIPNRHG